MKTMILAALCLLAAQAGAQIRVQGTVINQQQKGIAATVTLLRGTDSSTIVTQATSATGGFELLNVMPGRYRLRVTSVGFQPVTESITVTTGQPPQPLTIILLPVVNQLSEATVTGRKRLFENLPDRTVLNVQASPGAAGQTVLDVIGRSPNMGIDRQNNQLQMNGKNGVVVMLNGKPLRMEQQALLQYLSGLPAANIRKIEFIHTPPASMDAAGNAGVINIETIKKEDEGMNGGFTLHAGFGERGKFGGSFNLNFHKGRFNFFTDITSTSNYTQQNLINRANSATQNLNTFISLFSNRPAVTGLQNGRMGLDYQLTRKTSVGVLLSGYLSQWTLDAHTQTTTTNDTGFYSLSQLRSVETNNWKHGMANINFQHTFSNKARLTADADYLYYNDNNPTQYTDNSYDKNNRLTGSSNFNSRKKTPIVFKVANIDYSKTVTEKVKIQTGVKTTLSSFTNDVGVDRLVNSVWEQDPAFTDVLRLKENIFAVYAAADYQPAPGTVLKAGLRYEKTNSDLQGSGSRKLLSLNYGRLFPVLYFSHRFKNNRQLQLSYNERITRPPINTIAPAFFFFGPNSILAGNPAVRPTISRQLTTSLQAHNFLFTLQLSNEEKPVTFQPLVDTTRNFLVVRAENMKASRLAMLSAAYSLKVKKWTGQYTVALFAQQLQPVLNGTTLTRNDVYFTLNLTQGLQLPAGFMTELSNQTNGRRNIGLGQYPFSTSFNLALQKSFSKKNKLALSWNDVLNTGSFLNYSQPQLASKYDFEYEFEGSVVKLSWVHQFGNDKLKKTASRKAASEEELKRVN
jgi:hypothetical protein